MRLSAIQDGMAGRLQPNCSRPGRNILGKRIEIADDSQIAAERAVGECGPQTPRAVAPRSVPARDRVEIDLTLGWSVQLSRSFSARLATASLQECEQIEIVGAGLGLHWAALDEDCSVPAVLGALAVRAA